MILKFKTNKKKKERKEPKENCLFLKYWLPRWHSGKEPHANAGDGDTRNMGSIPGQEDPLQ